MEEREFSDRVWEYKITSRLQQEQHIIFLSLFVVGINSKLDSGIPV